MAEYRITFDKVNFSAQVNDLLYFLADSSNIDAHLVNGDYTDTTTTIYDQAGWDANSETGIVTQDEWTLVADASGDQLGHGMSIDAGVLKRDNTNNGSNSSARQKVDVINGVTYTVSYDRKYTAGTSSQTNIFMNFGTGNKQLADSTSTVNTFETVTDTFTAAFTGEMFFRIYFIDDMEGEIDNVTITPVAGFKAPVLVGRIHSIVDQVNFVALRVRDEFNVANQDYVETLPAGSTELDGVTAITTITIEPGGEPQSYINPDDETVVVEYIPTFQTNPNFPDLTLVTNPFFMFLKNEIANVSNVKGYYAKAKMETSATNKVELFAVGSEIALSSK